MAGNEVSKVCAEVDADELNEKAEAGPARGVDVQPDGELRGSRSDQPVGAMRFPIRAAT